MIKSSINLDYWITRLLDYWIIRMLEKIYFTVFYLLLIPFLKIIFAFISKKIESKNIDDIPLLNIFYKFFRVYVNYLFPIIVFILIINKWIN